MENAGEGLGAVFNGLSCAECHAIHQIGGSLSRNLRRETRSPNRSLSEKRFSTLTKAVENHGGEAAERHYLQKSQSKRSLDTEGDWAKTR